LLAAGQQSVPGRLGSWTLDDHGSDSPWLPAVVLREVAVGTGALGIRYADGTGIGHWSAHAAPASDPGGLELIGLGERDGAVPPPLQEVRPETPPRGQWVLAVRLDRADGRGDATYFWLIRVD
jgi:hypothetical protein